MSQESSLHLSSSVQSPVVDHALLPTEQINPDTVDIDMLSTEALLHKINQEDQKVALAVQQAIPQIAKVVDQITAAFLNGGRLFYFGAGTSGRLGVLDASECPPTFGAKPEQVQGIIAGGDVALRNAVEGAEDSAPLGQADVKQAGIESRDVVVGLSASGQAPYVVAAVEAAKKLGCFTAAITCNATGPLSKAVDEAIVADVGPEVVAGSTRLKAGTAQKLILNMLTTGAMIQSGKTYQNLMVDVQPTNLKLRARARRIVSTLGQIEEPEAERLLEQTVYQVKPAVLMARGKISLLNAQQLLNNHSGKLRLALAALTSVTASVLE